MVPRSVLGVLAALAAIHVAGVACTRPSPAPPSTEPAPSGTGNQTGIMAGLGQHHHPIATSNPEAQRFFDQGFSLVYAFNHEEAVRSFQEAARLDPGQPMPQWGIAWALGPNYNLDIDDPRSVQASQAIARAKALSATGPENERAYVEALAVRYSADPTADRVALARRYSDAMRNLARRYPDDLDAQTLYAESLMNLRPWKLWNLDGTPAEGTPEIVSTLESVLRRAPNHLGANHYYIHTVEASREPDRALPSAGRLPALAPAAGHLVHMPAHVYARTGDHEGAARANAAGAAADRAYLATTPADSYYALAYSSHNLHFLTDSHMMLGRLGDARRAADELATQLGPHAQMMPMIESMLVAPTNVLLRFGRDEQILALPQPAVDRPVMTAWWHFARGVALARTRKPVEALAERRALDHAIAGVPDSALFGGTGLESAKTVLALSALVLDARVAWARGTRDEAIVLWRRAVDAADRLPYDEPPVWFYPIRESLGAALLAAGKPVEAETVFREDLVRHPRNGRSLFGLRESLVRQNRTSEAAWVEREIQEAWRHADMELSLDAF